MNKGIYKWFNTGSLPVNANDSTIKSKKRDKNDKLLEHNIQSTIIEYLKAKNIFCYRQNTGVDRTGGRWISYGVVGGSDIVAVIDGKYIAIEVKGFTKSGKPTKQSENQVKFQQKLEKAGGMYYCVHSLDEVIAIIENSMLWDHTRF